MLKRRKRKREKKYVKDKVACDVERRKIGD